MQWVILALTLLKYGDARGVIEDENVTKDYITKYEKQVLKSYEKCKFLQLGIDYNTNTLFYSYDIQDKEVRKNEYIDLKTNEFGVINGSKLRFAKGIDDVNNIVYLGGNDGIYKFDYNTKVATHVSSTDSIWQLFFKKQLYYTTYPGNQAYILRNGHSMRVPELMDTTARRIAVDNDENIYFSNSSGLFVHNKTKSYISYVGNYDVFEFTSDINGELLFSTQAGIFYINDKTKNVEKLISVPNVFGLAVEVGSTIIYSTMGSIVRLKPFFSV